MTGASRSLFVFGIYLGALGVLLLLFPNLLLRTFGAPVTNEIWIRVNGMFVICLAYYYIQAARHGVTAFIRWTVWARAAVIVYFVAFVLGYVHETHRRLERGCWLKWSHDEKQYGRISVGLGGRRHYHGDHCWTPCPRL
jgi:hypothetical protein